MFYSQFILAKKGPLGTIWIAAHLERKLRKNQVAETDIGVTVDSILFPDVPIALRLSGHLLLGVVRVYSRQVNYLFNDCSETLVKIKQAFRSTAVDLPAEATTAPFHSITLPETFDFDELELLADSDSVFLSSSGKHVHHHVTTREQITLQDNTESNPYLGLSQFELDERFGDGNCSSMALDFDEEFLAAKAYSGTASASTPLLKEDTIPPLTDDTMQMDIDDPYATFEPQHNNNDIVADREEPVVFRIDQNDGQDQDQSSLSLMPEPHNHGNTSTPYLEPPTGPAVVEEVLSTAAYRKDVPNFHAYTPYTEACTPDLNLEFRPPDEPSTPALLDEASFSMCKESSFENQRRIPSGLQENAESNAPDIHPALVLSSNQIASNTLSDKPNEQICSAQLGPSSPTLGLHHADGVDSAVQPSSPFVEAEAFWERPELCVTSQGFTFDSKSSAEMPKNTVVQTVPSEDDRTNEALPVSGSEAQFRSIDPMCQEVVPTFQPQGTTISEQSSSQNIVQDPVGSPQCRIVQNDMTGEPSPSMQADTISVSATMESASIAHAEAADPSLEPSITAEDGNADRDPVWLDVADVPQCETLRSIADCPEERSGMLLLEKNMLDENIPALELELVKSGTENNIVPLQPELDETPVLKERTPRTAAKASPLSAGYLDYLPGDDDVLASILGRRKSSAFKVAPTPTENVVVKRRKVSSRSLSKKRRGDFDTLPVLHGDVIRQQLANTEDIRRERHKAPCTRREVWCFNKEVEGQQNFDEPSIPGLSRELQDLFEDVLIGSDSRDTLLSMDSGNTIQVMKSAEDMIDINRKDTVLPSESRDLSKDDTAILDRSGLECLPNQLGGVTETNPETLNENSERFQCLESNARETEHSGEFPSINDDNSLMQNMPDSEIPVQVETVASEEHGALKRTEECQQESLENITVDEDGNIGNTQCSPKTMENGSNGNIDGDAGEESILAEATLVNAEDDMQRTSPQLTIQSADHVENGNNGNIEDDMERPSPQLTIQSAEQVENCDAGEDRMLAEATLVSVEDNVQCISPQLFMQNADQVDAIHNDELTSQELLPDPEKDATNSLIVKYQEHVDGQDISEAQLESREDDGIQVDVDASKDNVHVPNSDVEPSGFMGNAGNTDFLAEDDDLENAEIYEDSGDERDPSVLENSGWSVRSRNVGRYLKSVFEAMDDTYNRMHQEYPTLGLDRLLARKTRKEAARMFFETLVLKTRDYIHVEQKLAYEDIHLYPKPKLMKNSF